MKDARGRRFSDSSFYSPFFIWQLLSSRDAIGRDFAGSGKLAVYTAPLLLFVLPCLAMMEPACADPWILFGTLFLILFAASAYAIYAEEGAIYYIAAVFALLTEMAWSIKHLTPERLYSGLALYAIFGLFFIGVPIAAQRLHKQLRPEKAGAGLLLVSLALLFFLAVGPIASVSIWGLALLLLILNVGLFWQGSTCKLPILAVAGMVLSWIILGVLWASTSLADILIPALVVMAGFALLVLAGNIWLQKQAAGADAFSFGERHLSRTHRPCLPGGDRSAAISVHSSVAVAWNYACVGSGDWSRRAVYAPGQPSSGGNGSIRSHSNCVG